MGRLVAEGGYPPLVGGNSANLRRRGEIPKLNLKSLPPPPGRGFFVGGDLLAIFMHFFAIGSRGVKVFKFLL